MTAACANGQAQNLYRPRRTQAQKRHLDSKLMNIRHMEWSPCSAELATVEQLDVLKHALYVRSEFQLHRIYKFPVDGCLSQESLPTKHNEDVINDIRHHYR